MPTLQQKRLLLADRNVYNPKTISNLELWLAARFVTGKVDGDALGTTLSDQSGLSRDASQATGSKQPLYKTNIANNQPALRFDTSDDYLQTPSINLTGTNGITLFVVVANITAGSNRVIAELSADANTAANLGFTLLKNTSNQIDTYVRGAVGFSEFLSTATVTTGPVIISVTYDKAQATNEVTNWLNGVSAGTRPSNSNNIDNFGNQPLYIGMRGGTTLPFGGDLLEILMYSRILSTAEREYNQRGLGSIYNIATS
jgi:hypothetical protein